MAEHWSAAPEWISKAEGDWEALEILLTRNSPGLRDAVVFHAQQCVQKLLKARLIQHGQMVDKIHDLAALSRQLEAVDDRWSWDGEELDDLSSGAVLARYPGFETLGLPQFGGQVSGPHRFEFTGADELLLVSDRAEVPDR